MKIETTEALNPFLKLRIVEVRFIGNLMTKKKKNKKNSSRAYLRVKTRKNSETSKWIWRMLSISVLLLFLGLIIWGTTVGYDCLNRTLFTENSLFEIQHLEISSDGRLNEDKIRTYAEISEGMNLFKVSFKEIERRLKGNPLVENVHIWRSLPHTLHITVTERIPQARIQGLITRAYPLLISHSGYILPPRQKTDALPLIKGTKQKLKAGERITSRDITLALQIISECESSNYQRKHIHIRSLNLEYDDYIEMWLQKKIRVRMPRHAIRSKLRKLAAVVENITGQGNPLRNGALIDLTVDSPKVPITIY